MEQGRPVDYSGMSYEKLTGGSGIQWPCNEEYPDGRERLYTDSHFPTTVDECESFGHDLFTGTIISPEAYKAMNPNGRAILKACHYTPPDETTDEDYPFRLVTGRVFAQFHSALHRAYYDFHADSPPYSSNQDGSLEGAP